MKFGGAVIANARALLFAAFASACVPRKILTVSEWADSKRWLSKKASSKEGWWRTLRTPFLREPMDCLSLGSPVQLVILMFCTQSGKSEVGLNWIGYVIDHAPAPMLVVLPTLEVRKRWVLQRLEPLLKESPALAAIFGVMKTRDASNGRDIKDYGEGLLVLGGANSAASLASMPIQYVLCDEVDRFKWELKGEGDPLGLIDNRQKAFTRRKQLRVSTPTVRGASRIEEDFERSDRRRYHVPCPLCGTLIVLRWSNLKYNAALTRAVYLCEHCDGEIEERHKTQMLAGGVWIAENPDSPIRGYHINALYAPDGLGYTWLELAREWIGVQDDRVKLKRFVNTQLAETWEDKSRDIRPNVLLQRAEPYRLRQIPPGCLILIAGIDTQDDRFSIQLLGWGEGEVCWVLDWHEIPGNPGREETQMKLAAYLNARFENSFGREMRIAASGIDTGGHFTHEIYNFVRSKPAPRLIAFKGANTPGKAILSTRPQHQDVNWRGKTIRQGVALYTIGTDTAKHWIYNRLLADEGVEPAARKIHFSQDLPPDYYDQVVSEVFDPEKNRFLKRRGRRNEGLDTFVYACAAAQHPEVRVHAMRPVDWRALRRVLEPEPEAAQPGGSTVPVEPRAPAAAKKQPQRPSDESPFGSSDWKNRL